MATRLTSNFSYQAEDFLDARIKQAKTLEDLKNWDILVPRGFEIVLDGVWYSYDPDYELLASGHWIPRVTNDPDFQGPSYVSAGVESVKEVKEALETTKEALGGLDNSMYPTFVTSIIATPNYTSTIELDADKNNKLARLSRLITDGIYDPDYDINKDGRLDTADVQEWNEFYERIRPSIAYNQPGTSGTYWMEVGSVILPRLSWIVVKPSITWTYSGTTVTWKLVPGSDKTPIELKSSSVLGSSGKIEGTDTLPVWIGSEIFSSDVISTKTLTIKSTTKNDIEAIGYAYFKFGVKTYTGAGSLEAIWNKTVLNVGTDLAGWSNRFVETGTLGATNFNCTGGKYPYILIPKAYYKSSYKTYMSGNLNSDFVTKEITVINNRGVSIPYVLYRTGYIQTGNPISIEIK